MTTPSGGRGRRLSRAARFAWSGLGLAALVAGWAAAHRAYGVFVMPDPRDAVAALARLAVAGTLLPAIAVTARDALAGFLAGALAGLVLGGLAGIRPALHALLAPLATILVGVPAIAWVVLALIWFGGAGPVAALTVAVTAAPIVFAAAAAGVASLDGDLALMARAFRAPRRVMIVDLYLPHMLGHVFPALATALASAWKVAVMAEVLAGAGGIGDGIARARAEVDTAATMAWILVIVVLLIAVERLALDPLRRRVETWRDRDAAAP
jgi:NitT/TauT family transport system permease protein